MSRLLPAKKSATIFRKTDTYLGSCGYRHPDAVCQFGQILTGRGLSGINGGNIAISPCFAMSSLHTLHVDVDVDGLARGSLSNDLIDGANRLNPPWLVAQQYVRYRRVIPARSWLNPRPAPVTPLRIETVTDEGIIPARSTMNKIW